MDREGSISSLVHSDEPEWTQTCPSSCATRQALSPGEPWSRQQITPPCSSNSARAPLSAGSPSGSHTNSNSRSATAALTNAIGWSGSAPVATSFACRAAAVTRIVSKSSIAFLETQKKGLLIRRKSGGAHSLFEALLSASLGLLFGLVMRVGRHFRSSGEVRNNNVKRRLHR